MPPCCKPWMPGSSPGMKSLGSRARFHRTVVRSRLGVSSANPQGLARRNGRPARASMVSRGRVRAPPWLLPHVVIPGLVPDIRASLSTNYYIVMPGFIPGIFLRGTHVDGRNTCGRDAIVMPPFAACSPAPISRPTLNPGPRWNGSTLPRPEGTYPDCWTASHKTKALPLRATTSPAHGWSPYPMIVSALGKPPSASSNAAITSSGRSWRT